MDIDNIIFIVGCGHSGTTILNKILGNHKNIYGIKIETSIFNYFDDCGVINNLKEFIINRNIVNKKWICEKTPIHVYHLKRMYKLVNDPKIIIMIRDGRDVVASLFKRYLDFNKSINRWINDNFEWLNYYDLTNNINLFNDNRFHIIKYENFVYNTKFEIQKICEFIGEEYDENILNYEKKLIEISKEILENPTNENHNLLRFYQINKEIYDGKGRYSKELTEQQLEQLYSNEKFIYLMKLFGYL